MNVAPDDLDHLRHMLGVGSHIARDKWGYRNYYAAGLDDLHALERLVNHGLCIRGPERDGLTYYYATEAGCRTVGLTDDQIERMQAYVQKQAQRRSA